MVVLVLEAARIAARFSAAATSRGAVPRVTGGEYDDMSLQTAADRNEGSSGGGPVGGTILVKLGVDPNSGVGATVGIAAGFKPTGTAAGFNFKVAGTGFSHCPRVVPDLIGLGSIPIISTSGSLIRVAINM